MRDYIYVIEAVGVNSVKIGVSGAPKARLHDIQVCSPVKLCMRFQMPHRHADKIEQEVHRNLGVFNTHGKWFAVPVNYAVELIEKTAKDMFEPEKQR